MLHKRAAELACLSTGCRVFPGMPRSSYSAERSRIDLPGSAFCTFRNSGLEHLCFPILQNQSNPTGRLLVSGPSAPLSAGPIAHLGKVTLLRQGLPWSERLPRIGACTIKNHDMLSSIRLKQTERPPRFNTSGMSTSEG